ncbi:hypothetical protein QZH41_016350, partial [Actinostola sp. cb2023]
VLFATVSRDHWPQLGTPVTQDLLDELVYDDILSKPLAVGFFLRGAAGPPGPNGDRGPPGTQGTQGDYGMPGFTGYRGGFGPQGIIGPRGQPGSQGMRGLKGFRGVFGSPGLAGYPGYPSFLTNTTTICEGGNGALLCADQKIVKITQAFWGRDNYYTCAQPTSSSMTSSQLTQMDPDHVRRTLKYQCTDKQSCPITATRLAFGDIADPAVSKYLKVWYECIPDHRDLLLKARRFRRDVFTKINKEKREFFLPFHDKTEVKDEHNRDVSEAENEQNLWDKSNEQLNKTNSRAAKIGKRQSSKGDNTKLAHILNELMHPASSIPT